MYRLNHTIANRWPRLGVGNSRAEPLLLSKEFVAQLSEALHGEFSADEIRSWFSWWTKLPKYQIASRQHRAYWRSSLAEITELASGTH